MRVTGYGPLTVGLALIATIYALPSNVTAHGDVAPQPVDTTGLPPLGEDWLEQNPWREPSSEFWATAVKIGASGFNQNCARCHGLGAISGGIAPDLRFLEANFDGDDWFKERFRHGYTQNGITKMPAFGDLLGQEAGWAIRTYIETRPDEDAMEEHGQRLKAIRDELNDLAKFGNDADMAEITKLRDEMLEIAGKVPTLSGAPVADSIASRAAGLLDGSDGSIHRAVEALSIGLSAAK